MRRFRLILLLLVSLGSLRIQQAAPATTGSLWKRIIVHCDPDDLENIRQVLGAAILDASHGHYLLNVPSTANPSDVTAIPGKQPIVADDDRNISIPGGSFGVKNATTAKPGAAPDLGRFINYFGSRAPRIYTDQTAARQINLAQALQVSTGARTRVAVIDTGVDFAHPTLRGVLLPGRNYIGRTPFPDESDDPILTQSQSEWSQVLQSQSEWSQVLQSQSEWSQVLQSQSEWAQVLQSQSEWAQVLSRAPMYGHGTVVAGIVHLVAPDAMIIPLKAFDAEGFSDEWTIIRAIYDAVEMGADVINMSFGSYQRSRLVEEAINRAVAQGVVIVAAAGNDNQARPIYPASLDNVIAVTSVTAFDTKAAFANFGRYVDVASPGQHIVSTYPGGYCQVSGTSESAPFVSGVVALAKAAGVRERKLVSVVEAAVDEVNDGPNFKNKLGSGRINAAKAVNGNN